MRWINKYHRGGNRLWLVLSCLLAFAFVSLLWISGVYQVYLYDYMEDYQCVKPYHFPYSIDPNEETIKRRVQKRWREWGVNDKSRKRLPKTRIEADTSYQKTRIRILNDIRSMAEVKFFTDRELNTVVKNAIEYEKEYQAALKAFPLKRWMTRGRIVRDLLGAFIVTFAIGHGVFFVVWWIVQGFR